jgi:hypothetical protein
MQVEGVSFPDEIGALLIRLITTARELVGHECIYRPDSMKELRASRVMPTSGKDALGVFARILPRKRGCTVLFGKAGAKRWILSAENLESIEHDLTLSLAADKRVATQEARTKRNPAWTRDE